MKVGNLVESQAPRTPRSQPHSWVTGAGGGGGHQCEGGGGEQGRNRGPARVRSRERELSALPAGEETSTKRAEGDATEGGLGSDPG